MYFLKNYNSSENNNATSDLSFFKKNDYALIF